VSLTILAATFLVTWWIVLFATLPWGVRTQEEDDSVVPGTAPSAPVQPLLLRKAAAPLLPHRIVSGRKRGFSIPAAAWLRGELEPFARDVLAPDTLRRQGYFRPDPVTRLIDRHVAGDEDLSRQLWGLLAFTLWHEHHVARTPGALREARLAEGGERHHLVLVGGAQEAEMLGEFLVDEAQGVRQLLAAEVLHLVQHPPCGQM
jgi:predicted secreted protein